MGLTLNKAEIGGPPPKAARGKLSLRLAAAPMEKQEDTAVHMLKIAMEHRLCVRWTYNRTAMETAPQILYRMNDKLYCDALVQRRSGPEAGELKLASFRLAGLADIVLTNLPLVAWSDLDTASPRYAATLARIAIL